MPSHQIYDHTPSAYECGECSLSKMKLGNNYKSGSYLEAYFLLPLSLSLRLCSLIFFSSTLLEIIKLKTSNEMTSESPPSFEFWVQEPVFDDDDALLINRTSN